MSVNAVRFFRNNLKNAPYTASGYGYSNMVAKDQLNSPAMGSSLWDTCPGIVEPCDPSFAFNITDRFAQSVVATNAISGYTTTAATTGTLTIDAVKGPSFDAGAVTANQGLNFQLTQTPFFLTKGIWFEGQWDFGSAFTSTNQKLQFLFGLAAAQTALIASGTVGTDAKIAFDGVTTTGAILADCCASATSGTAAAFTFANSTKYKLGFYATPFGVDFWVNGAKVQTLTANIPASTVALAPSVVVQANATVRPVMFLRWYRCFSLN